MKYKCYFKVFKTTCRMTKHLLTYKVRRRTVRCTVPRNTLHKINCFPIAKSEAMLTLVKPISKKKSSYTNAPDRKDPTNIDEKMLDRSEAAKKPEVKYITLESKYITSTQSRLGIQFI